MILFTVLALFFSTSEQYFFLCTGKIFQVKSRKKPRVLQIGSVGKV